jgi:glycosyltransferase 2 family protein
MIQKLQACPRLVSAARAIFSVVLLALLFYFLPVAQLWSALRGLSAAVWLGMLGAYVLGHVVALLKWRMMVNLAGAELSYVQAARCYFGGLFATLFLPSIMGGDVVRLSLAMRDAHSRTGTALACLLDRVIDFAALVSLAGCGVLLLHGSLNATSQRIFWSLAALALAAGSVAVVCLLLLPVRRFPRRVRRVLAQLRQSWRAMVAERQYVFLALLLGIAVQCWFVFLTAQIADRCGLHVPFHGWLVAWPLAKLSALAPLTQGGIGVREVALAALLAPFGASPILTVGVGLVFEAFIVATSLFGGLLSFLAGRMHSLTQRAGETGELVVSKRKGSKSILAPGRMPLPGD